MNLTNEKVDKRRGNSGRSKGSGTYKVYKWKVLMYDKELNRMKEGKFCSIAHINREWDLKLNGDLTHRIQTLYRADMSMRNGENSFLKRWGHIHLEKIHEPVLETDGNAGEKAVLKNEEEDGTAPNAPNLPENPAEPAS